MVPPAINGIALGWCGLGLVMGGAQKLPRAEVICTPAGWCHNLGSFAFILGGLHLIPFNLARAVIRWELFSKELFRLGRVSAFSTATMALIALGTETLAINVGFGKFVLGLAIFLQLYINVHFMIVCVVVSRDTLPEPCWFPPTVGIALGGKGGVAADWPLTADICLGISLVFLVVLMVPISFRVAKSASVAANTSVYILIAPAFLVLAMWQAVAGNPDSFFRPAWVGVALFVTSVVLAVQTFVALFQRRRQVQAVGFTPGWSAFTFPSAAAVNGIMAARVHYFSDSLAFLAFVWVLVAAYILVIFFVGGMFLWHLPSWLRRPGPSTECVLRDVALTQTEESLRAA